MKPVTAARPVYRIGPGTSQFQPCTPICCGGAVLDSGASPPSVSRGARAAALAACGEPDGRSDHFASASTASSSDAAGVAPQHRLKSPSNAVLCRESTLRPDEITCDRYRASTYTGPTGDLVGEACYRGSRAARPVRRRRVRKGTRVQQPKTGVGSGIPAEFRRGPPPAGRRAAGHVPRRSHTRLSLTRKHSCGAPPPHDACRVCTGPMVAEERAL